MTPLERHAIERLFTLADVALQLPEVRVELDLHWNNLLNFYGFPHLLLMIQETVRDSPQKG